ncbi:MAG: hypothetical protein IH789_13585, partial [Acidobacteria bacterium]|nr:hypothetical protein [Acidobacteriota bacterium]
MTGTSAAPRVNRYAVLSLLILCGAAAAAQVEPPPEVLRIVFIAYQNPDRLMDEVQPVVAYLEQKLGLRVRPFVA